MVEMTNSDISTLISRVAVGDRASFRQLYAQTSAKLFGVCLRILKDGSEAEEALQEAYLKVWRNASQFAPSRYSPMSWLIAIARNQSIDRLRARRPVALDLDVASEIESDQPNPEESALRSDARTMIEHCLKELTQQKADAVRGAYLDGYSYQELSERLAIPINTIRTWLRRSLIRLKECLER